MNALKICYDSIKQHQKASIDGYLCNSITELLAIFNRYTFPNDFVFADLSMGVWKANQVANEFIEQLKKPTDNFTKPTSNFVYQSQSSGSYLQFANIAGEGIDAESLGDTNLNQCLGFCDQILQLLSQNPTNKIFVLLLPMDDSTIYKDNEAFINFFATLTKKIGYKFVAINRSPTTDYPTIHFNWINKDSFIKENRTYQTKNEELINLLPGLVPGTILKNQAHNFIALNNQQYLIPIENRSSIGEISKLNFDKLASCFNSFDEVKAYALYNGNTYFIDGVFLSKFAWKQFGSGARDLAFKLLTKVYNSASNGSEKAAILCQLQGLRIALWKFEEVATATMPSGNKVLSVQRFLFIAKGWGAVMTGDLETATLCLNEAKKLFDATEHQSKEFLYLLNISALLLLKNGEPEKAMLLEKQIEHTVHIHAMQDYQLQFVNAINLARLFKKNKDFPTALDYYLKAFHTINGLKQESDFVYYNLILSHAYSDAGNSQKSFYCLLRSALNLLVTVFPKSVSKRLYVALGLPALAQEAETDPTEEINHYFIRQLSNHPYAFQNFGSAINGQNLAAADLPFFLSSQLFNQTIHAALGTDGVSIFVSKEVEESISYKTNSTLASIVYQMLTILFGDRYPFKQIKSIIIDTNSGFDIPQTKDELIPVSIKLKSATIIWQQQQFDLAAITDQTLLEPISISLHPGVNQIEEKENGIVISFKRYYPTISLSKNYSAILKKLVQKAPPFTAAEIEQIPAAQLNWLQEKKIISFIYNTNEICKRAGCKLHLNES